MTINYFKQEIKKSQKTVWYTILLYYYYLWLWVINCILIGVKNNVITVYMFYIIYLFQIY